MGKFQQNEKLKGILRLNEETETRLGWRNERLGDGNWQGLQGSRWWKSIVGLGEETVIVCVL